MLGLKRISGLSGYLLGYPISESIQILRLDPRGECACAFKFLLCGFTLN